MKKLAFLLVAVLCITISCMEEKEISKSSLEVYADSLFQVSVDSAEIAGGAILVFQHGKSLLKKSYGYANLELSVPMPNEANFEIGSVTKQFTAAAILKLVEAEKLSLKDDFTQYLEFDTKGRIITIGNLLNHTSGIAGYTELPEFWELSIQDHPRDSLVRLVEQKDFLFQPGEALIYSNSAYFFLGLIIEKVSGQTYEEYLRATFFEPLGMNYTYYCSTTKVVKNKVDGYNYTPRGLQQKPYLNHAWPYAAGSLCSTTQDLLIWMRAMHEGKLLSEPLSKSLITPGQLNDGTAVRYAKGLVNYMDFGNHRIGHGGGIHGFLSETSYYPDADLYIICLINTTGPKGAGYFADKIIWRLLEKEISKGVELDVDIETLVGKYTGVVRGSTLSLDVNSISNGLTVQAIGAGKIDTLKTYLGNNTWSDGNDRITIKENEYHIDQPYAHYVLKKVD